MKTLIYTDLLYPGIDGDGQVLWPLPDDVFSWIEPSSERDLRRAPELEKLLKLGQWIDDRVDYADLTSVQWLYFRIHGRLFRSYTKGTDTFIHMRQLDWRKTVFATVRDGPHECPGLGCLEHTWTEATCFNGTFVGQATTLLVYAALGEEMEWLTPSRGLRLPDEAWGLLHAERQRQMVFNGGNTHFRPPSYHPDSNIWKD